MGNPIQLQGGRLEMIGKVSMSISSIILLGIILMLMLILI